MRRSPEEVAAWRERIKGYEEEIKAMPEAEAEAEAERHGILKANGQPLSVKNSLMLLRQAEGKPLSRVAGFQQWKKYKRFVPKGQHAIGYAFAPSKSVKKNGDEYIRFILVPYFDISQTEETRAA